MFKKAKGIRWAEQDQPIAVRVKGSVAFGMKSIMIKELVSEKRALWADPDIGCLWLGDEEVVSKTEVQGAEILIT